jgi:hypothetical protein
MNIQRVITLLFKSNTDAIKTVLTRFLILLVILSVACFIALAGISYLVWSSYLYLSTIFAPFVAALITGGGLILIGVLLALIGLHMTSGAKERKRGTTSDFLNPDDIAGASKFINEYPLESGLTAAMLGFLAGSSPDVRKTLADMLVELKQDSRIN